MTLPRPQKRDFTDKYTWVVSPRIYDKRTDTHVCCDTGGGPFARQWCTAKAGLVDFGYLKATGHSIQMVLPRSPNMPEMELEWNVPEKSNAIERDRARTYHQAYSALIALHCLERAMKEVRAGRTKSWNKFKVPDTAVSVRLPRGRARRALPPHGDPRRQDRELPALPADAVERQPARRLRNPGTLRGRGAEHADLRGERARELQGRRHHARGALVRPVPAVRRAHVHRRRQGAQGHAHADGDGAERDGAVDARCARRAPSSCSRVSRSCRSSSRPPASSVTRELAEELVSRSSQMYGAGPRADRGRAVRRRRATASGSRSASPRIRCVATLLLIHDLHPVPLEERVQAALDSVRPYMESHGGNVELLSLEDGVARIRLQGSCSDCSASSVDARARDQAGARGGRPGPRRPRGRGRRAADRSAARPADGERHGAATGCELPVVMSARRHAPVPPSWFEVRVGGRARATA